MANTSNPDVISNKDSKGEMHQSLKDITVKCAMTSHFHGVGHIFNGSSQVRRGLWGSAVLLSLLFFISCTLEHVTYMMSYPVTTNIKMEWATQLIFPAVTICNINPKRLSSLTTLDLFHVGYWMGLLHSNQSFNFEGLAVLSEEKKQQILQLGKFEDHWQKNLSEVNTMEVVDRLSHQIEDMILQCKYQGTDCTADNFTSIFTRYGKCYTFNSGKPGHELLTTLKGGTGNGLELMLDIQQDEYLPIWGETEETSFEAGIKVQIHSQDEPPFIDQLGFGVAPGFQTFVSCQQQQVSNA